MAFANILEAMQAAKAKTPEQLRANAMSGTPLGQATLERQAELDAALAKGEAKGKEYFGAGSLGRLENPYAKEQSDILARRKSSLAGLAAPEYQALREDAYSGLNQGLQTGLRQLRSQQGASGVRGGAATAQGMNLANAAQQQRRGLERDLLLKNYGIKQEALGNYEKTAGGLSQFDQGMQKYNIGQGAKEKYGQLGTMMGYGQLGQGVGGLAQGDVLSQAMLDAANQQRADADAMRTSPQGWWGDTGVGGSVSAGAASEARPIGSQGPGDSETLLQKFVRKNRGNFSM
jgi:hypothetical protein